MTEEHRMELLAPAGSPECLRAAVRAGADAVYLGLDEFNARRNARNFTLESLREACDYAHLRGVSVYVTMNVEVLPAEASRARDAALKAWDAGADALIVQDIGLASSLRQLHPGIPLHASTQMNIHNAAGVEAAARLGLARITFARELSIEEASELTALAHAFGMQTECFGHGALCICYSGQCLMSSMIGGRSANRGLCAQACRLPYQLFREDREAALPAPGEHLLSPRDLCTIDLLGELRAAGIDSLKIEGRMKSADYVHEVVSVYREALDSPGPATEQQKARLAEAFSRGFSTAYLTGERGNDMMSYARPNNRGVFVGRVSQADGDTAQVTPETELHAGDVVEFWTNRGHFAAQVTADADAGSNASIPIDGRTGKGDRVFRVRNARTAFADDPLEPRVGVSGTVRLEIGSPARIEMRAGAVAGQATGDTVEEARTRAVTKQEVHEHVGRLGQTPFRLESLQVVMDEGVGIGFSRLHRLRAQALDELAGHMLAKWGEGKQESPARAAEARDRTAEEPTPKPEGTCMMATWATNPGCARAAKRAGADAVYVALPNFRRGQAQLQGARLDEAEQAGYPKQCVMALPAVDHDPVGKARELTTPFEMWDYVRAGKPVFADSLGGAVRALNAGASVEVGPHVPVTNRAALELLASWGVTRVWLGPELTLGQLAELALDAPVSLGLFVSGAQELMITEHCLLMSQGACNSDCATCSRRGVAHRLVDHKGFEFPVVTDHLGRSHLYNGIELDALPNLPDFIDMGISAFMVDTTLMGKREAESAVRRALKARDLALGEHRSVEKRTGTTTGHLFRGVQ